LLVTSYASIGLVDPGGWSRGTPNATIVLPLGRRRALLMTRARLSRAGRHSQIFRAR